MSYHRLLITCVFLIAVALTGCSKSTNQHDHEHTSHQMQTASTPLTIVFQKPTAPHVNQKITLNAQVKRKQEPIKDAQVEFEVWSNDKNKQKVKATQPSSGHYESSIQVKEEGDYNIIVHVTTPKEHQMISDHFTVGQ
ncbi:GBS Bsp-like repeat-containing protein [Seinonella peptonophila]|uniref:GBS Bsp-like repeat-containing protein n=1 Tax=Seinonella peptonophila TaxID=112248 RepID=A0A1M4YTV3_9BACL|nr:FixH family protein [Seinonella peptonophila]SHF08977.1 GBS Bsp-like repeat-containing protein [Seinonella peptonophila]